MKKTTLLPSGLRRLVPGLLLLLLFSSQGWGQETITPIRTDVSGFSTWTDIDIGGTTYLQLLKATAVTITPSMDFSIYTSETLNFKARTYGGTNEVENTVYIDITEDNGLSWTNIGNRVPTTNSLNAMSLFDLSSYNGTQVKLRFSVLGTSNSIGVGIDDISITGVLSITDTDPPLLLSTIPADGSSDINISTVLSLTFNENIVKGSGNISVYNASDVLIEAVDVSTEAVTITDATAVVDLFSDLSAGETYYVMVDATAFTDIAGNPYAGIANSTDWNFSTSATLSSDATLTDLQVDGTTIAGFDAGTVAYDVELPYGTTTVPTVTYTLSDATATVIQTDAASLPGTTSVEVTAQDSTTKKDYRINFTVAAPSSEATLTSASYTVDDGNETLTDIPYGTTLADFKAALTPATGAAFEVYLADGTTLATDLLSGYKVVVTAQDGTTQKTYTLTVNEPVIDLFFSEYIEGSSNNKALEIYNPTGADVDLSAYSVKLATNGASWGTIKCRHSGYYRCRGHYLGCGQF
ncbi:MAG: hypothetical protein CVU09_05565 [Bacteroidetes bacterium HGW-Bacteroidetes-4]|nr:MAG: hypothetical protein CVU09_05565 [Bacteroidetes bacterium HGW-Bacteroidetes-4]